MEVVGQFGLVTIFLLENRTLSQPLSHLCVVEFIAQFGVGFLQVCVLQFLLSFHVSKRTNKNKNTKENFIAHYGSLGCSLGKYVLGEREVALNQLPNFTEINFNWEYNKF